MKKKLILIGLSLLLAVPTQLDAKEVNFRHGSKDSGMARTVFPQVTGDLEANVLTLSICRYTGVAQICVSDNSGNMIQIYSEVIQGKSVIDLDLGDLAEGEYTVTVTLGDNGYFGIVSLN